MISADDNKFADASNDTEMAEVEQGVGSMGIVKDVEMEIVGNASKQTRTLRTRHRDRC